MNQIKAIRLSNLDESTAAMFTLLQPAIENIADQVCKTQSTDNITLSSETPYTSQILLDAINEAIEKAAVH